LIRELFSNEQKHFLKYTDVSYISWYKIQRFIMFYVILNLNYCSQGKSKSMFSKPMQTRGSL